MAPTARAFWGTAEDAAVLRLSGALRYPVASALRGVVDTIATTHVETFVIDLRETSYVDSTALGVLARIARASLAHSGRRAVIVCPDNDVATTLRSAAFDDLCVMVDDPPCDAPSLAELPLAIDDGEHGVLWRVILDAHRDLSSLSERNRDEYASVIAALEDELGRERQP